eukprot:m.148386 g.148386  ORF g.148386 m.148386 type:complete len:110 (-) comp14997_c0_seq1:128-457(-)
MSYSGYGEGATNRGNNLRGDDGEMVMDREVDALGKQVGLLKDIAIDIGAEIKDSNSFLNDMNKRFSSTGDLLGNSMARLKNLNGGSNTMTICSLIGFCFLVFMIIWFFI